jgi:hypothetical protein
MQLSDNDECRCVAFTFLQCNRKIPTWSYKPLRNHVMKRTDELEPCRPYSLKMIFGPQYWSGLRGFKTFAGSTWLNSLIRDACHTNLPVTGMRIRSGTGSNG